MSAIRLARGFTGRDKIIKFEGSYHGHADSLLVAGRLRRRSPRHARLAPACPTATRPRHARRALQRPRRRRTRCSSRTATQIAAIIVEPIAGNMGVVPPADGFLAGPARADCDEHGVAAHLRRGHHRLPRRAAAARRSSTA